MLKLWSSLVVLAVSSMVIVGSTYAQDAPKKKKGEHKRPSAEEAFKKLDTDKDGKLTVKEIEACPKIKDEAKAKGMLKKCDTNKDGSVCINELKAAFAKMSAHHHDHKKGGHKKGDHHKGAEKKKECSKKPAEKKECSKKPVEKKKECSKKPAEKKATK